MTTEIRGQAPATATVTAATAPPQPAPPVRETRKFTVAEYYRMAEVGILRPDERVELIEGEIILMPPIGPRHAGDVIRSIRLFSRLDDDRFVIQIQNPLHLADQSEPEPDVMLLRPRADDYTASHPTPADVLLVIEVADSSLDYDREVKAQIYGRAGVPETLVLNLPEDCIEGFDQPGPEGYAHHTIYRRGDRIRPVSLPDLELAVADLLPPPPAEPETVEPETPAA